MTSYPLPSYAASVWLNGDKLTLAFPGLDTHTQGHTVAVDIDISAITNLLTSSRFDHKNALGRDERKSLRGLLSVLHTLRERSHQNAPKTIGNPAAPTQYDLDQITRAIAGGKVRRIEPKREATEDLSLEDLDL